MFIAFLLGLLCVVLGMGCLHYGPLAYRRYRYVDDLPTSTVQSAAVGLTEVKGRVVAAEEPFPSPFREQPCVLCHYAYYGRPPADAKRAPGGGSWHPPRDTGTLGVPFYIEDETGRMLVRPEGAEIKLPNHLSYFISNEDRIEKISPPAVERFKEQQRKGTLPDLGGGRAKAANAVFNLMMPEGASAGPPTGPSRGAEVRLEEGDEVYVLGAVQPLNGKADAGKADAGKAGAGEADADGAAVQDEEALFIGKAPGSDGAFPQLLDAIPYLSAGYESIFEIYAGREKDLIAEAKREMWKQTGIGFLFLMIGLLVLVVLLTAQFYGGG